MITDASESEVTTHDLGDLERIPAGEGRRYRVANEEIAVFRLRSGEVFAVQANCPHRGGPLEDGLTGAGRVICPLHSHAFDLNSGVALRHTCDSLRTYPIEVTAEGKLLIQLNLLPAGV